MTEKRMGLWSYMITRCRERATGAILGAYVVLCLASAVYFTVCFHARSLAMSLCFMLFAPLLLVAEHLIGCRFGGGLLGGVLFVALGAIAGSSFDLYVTVPFFDTVLHGLSGVLFASVGFGVARRCFGASRGRAAFVGCLLFAVCFSLAVALVWELFEYACTALLGIDMMDDTFVSEIRSHVLAGTRTQLVTIDGITETVIRYADGKTYTLAGYLDLGLIDTVSDMIICTVGAGLFALLALIGHTRAPRLLAAVTPTLTRTAQD